MTEQEREELARGIVGVILHELGEGGDLKEAKDIAKKVLYTIKSIIWDCKYSDK